MLPPIITAPGYFSCKNMKKRMHMLKVKQESFPVPILAVQALLI